MRKRESGFSLVELLIAVAVVALLAAYGVPAYQDYVLRTRVAEVLVWLKPYQDAVVVNAQNGMPLYSGVVFSANQPKALKSVGKSSVNGLMQVVFKGGPLEDKTLLLVPKYMDSGTGQHFNYAGTLTSSVIPTGVTWWSCRSDTLPGASSGVSLGTMPAKYVPASCRGQSM